MRAITRLVTRQRYAQNEFAALVGWLDGWMVATSPTMTTGDGLFSPTNTWVFCRTSPTTSGNCTTNIDWCSPCCTAGCPLLLMRMRFSCYCFSGYCCSIGWTNDDGICVDFEQWDAGGYLHLHCGLHLVVVEGKGQQAGLWFEELPQLMLCLCGMLLCKRIERMLAQRRRRAVELVVVHYFLLLLVGSEAVSVVSFAWPIYCFCVCCCRGIGFISNENDRVSVWFRTIDVI